MGKKEICLSLDSSGFFIRSWRTSDRVSLIKHANNRNIWINLRDRFPYPYREEDANLWLNHTLEESDSFNLAIATAREAIGGIGLEFFSDIDSKSASLGYWLAESFWGRGIATAASRAIVAHAFGQFDLVRIFAEVFQWNPASMRVLEKTGFAREAVLKRAVFKDGQITDKVIYARVADYAQTI